MYGIFSFVMIVKIAFRNIVRQKRRSAVVIATVMIAVISVMMSQSFLNTMFDSMVSRAIETGLGHVQLRPGGYLETRQTDLYITNPENLENAISGRLPEGVHYSMRLEREAILRIGSDVKGVILLGINPATEGGVSTIPEWVTSGSFFSGEPDRSMGYECLLGSKNAEILELEQGDWFVLTTGAVDGSNTSFRCHIRGVFESPVKALDGIFIIMRLSDIAEIRSAGINPGVSYFVFHGKKIEDADKIKGILSGLTEGSGSFAYTYRDLEPTIAGYFELVDQFTWIFYFIILIGFGIVLFESITMSIFERIREIGIMHAIGTRPFFLFWMVLIEAFTLSLIGTILSIFAGSILVYILWYTGVDFSNMELGDQMYTSSIGVVNPYITIRNILDIVVITSVVSFFSGIYPGLKAVRISPIKAIYNR